jgi:ankyrin repeat protein
VWWSSIAQRTILIDKDAWATLMLSDRVTVEGGVSAIPKLVGCRAPLFEQVLEQNAASAAASHDGVSATEYADAVTQALMGAIVATDAAAAAACLRHGAHPARRQPWAFGRSTTALHVAAEKHQAGVAAAMIAGLAAREGRAPELCVADDDGNTPLHRACELGDLRMAALLMAHGGDLLARNGDGERPHDLCKMFYRHKFEDFRASVIPAVRHYAWRRRSHLGVALARRAQKATQSGAPHRNPVLGGTAAPAAAAASSIPS